jgi:hypothetical protein
MNHAFKTPIQLSKNHRTLESCMLNCVAAHHTTRKDLVEVNGFEPMTSCVQGRRSPS